MEFVCPYCGCEENVSLRNVSCPRCQQPLTVGPVLKLYLRRGAETVRRLAGGVRQRAKIRCPERGYGAPLSATKCPRCSTPTAVEDAVEHVQGSLLARWDQFEDQAKKDPRLMRRFQRRLLMFSAVVLWLMVGHVSEHRSEHWVQQLALCSVYLGVIAFIVSLIAPGKLWGVLIGYGWRAQGAVVLSYFSLLLLLQVFIGTFWQRSVTLAALFGVSYLAYVIWSVLMNCKGSSTDSSHHRISDPQGRRARYQ